MDVVGVLLATVNEKGNEMPKSVKGVMKEFKQGKLHSGSKKGPVVKNPKQAVAIALSEQREKRLKGKPV